VTTLSGKSLIGFTIANGNTSVAQAVSPALFSRLSNVQKAFEFYRFKKLSFSVPPWCRQETTWAQNTSEGTGALGYYPELTTSTTTSIQPMSVLSLDASLLLAGSVVNANTVGSTINACVLVPGDTCTRRLTVPRDILMGTTTRWFRTNATTSTEIAEITQGQLFFAVDDAAGANQVYLATHCSYTVEFCGNVDSTALTVPFSTRDEDSLSACVSVSAKDAGDGLVVGRSAPIERKSTVAVSTNPPRR